MARSVWELLYQEFRELPRHDGKIMMLSIYYICLYSSDVSVIGSVALGEQIMDFEMKYTNLIKSKSV
jgi:hypothetical protein